MTYGHAVVVGGGIAGLASTRALANHFERVTLVEADHYPSHIAPRKRVPQGSHIHTLLPGGLGALLKLFPNLENDLDTHGGLLAGPSDWYAHTSYGKTYRISRFQPTPLAPAVGEAGMRIQSRPLLEHCLRLNLEALPNVDLRNGAKVIAPATDKNRIVGVRIEGVSQDISADLVVDAGGRAGLTLSWLDQMGFPKPPFSAINCDIAYASALFEPEDPASYDGLGFLISSPKSGPYMRRGGSLVRIEGDKWLVTLIGRLGDYPPTDHDAFLAYIDTLNKPVMAEQLKTARMIGKPQRYGFPKSLRYHFERLASFPQGLLPMGDVICQLNPGYGQGMSVACQQAVAMDEVIANRRADNRTLDGLWTDFCPEAFERTRAAWVFAAMMDFSKDGTTGDFPEEEAAAIQKIKHLTKRADKGDLNAAHIVDAVFDIALPLRELDKIAV